MPPMEPLVVLADLALVAMGGPFRVELELAVSSIVAAVEVAVARTVHSGNLAALAEMEVLALSLSAILTRFEARHRPQAHRRSATLGAIGPTSSLEAGALRSDGPLC